VSATKILKKASHLLREKGKKTAVVKDMNRKNGSLLALANEPHASEKTKELRSYL